jgi:hypothetical protein
MMVRIKDYIERVYKSLDIVGIDSKEFKKDLREHIKLYLWYGFSIIPIKLIHKSLEKEDDEGKKPLLPSWKKYQKQPPTEEEVDRWFKTYEIFNVAIICGEVSNLSVLDVDDYSKSPVPIILDELAKKTTAVKTGKPNGIQVYSRGSHETIVLHSDPDIRIKGEGSYVLAPPSIHPSGNQYYFISELDQLAPCDFSKLVKAFRVQNQKAISCQTFEVKPKLPSLPPCIQALWDCEVKKGGRNEAAFVLASWFYLLGYPQDFISDLLRVWNASNNPPLSENELRNVVKSVSGHDYLTGCNAILNRISIIQGHGNISFNCSRCEFKAYQKINEAFIELTKEEITYEQILEDFKAYAPVDLFRRGQGEVVIECYKALQNFNDVVLNPLTGFGKTVIYLTITNKMQIPTIIICPDKGLQDQLEGYGIAVLKGRGNYECSLYNISAEVAPCTVKKMKCDVKCEWGERVEAEKIFKNETQIMVATEAAGEGINLQFCNLMINYDIPWNPNRLEQRMGRIHRYGQQKEVYIFNPVAEDTREGQVLSKVLDKLEEIRKAYGSDKVFDVIGEIIYGRKLAQLVLEAAAGARSMEEILKEIDIKVDEEYIAKVKNALGESLATKFIDYTRIKEMAEKAKEYRLIPEYVEEFFKKAFQKAGGRFRVRRDGFIAVEFVPYDMRKIAEDVEFRNSFGNVLKSYPKITFDKDVAFKNPDAEFVSFGHALLEALLEWVRRNYFTDMQRGAVFSDPSGRFNGVMWFFEGEVRDGKGEIAGKRLFAVYDSGENLIGVNPAVLWDLVPQRTRGDFEGDKEKVERFAITAISKYKEESLRERERQARIKEKYGIKSLEYLIGKLDYELVELYERQQRGENVDLVIRRKEERKREYERALEGLRKEIEREKHLSITMPRLLGAIVVKPHSEMVSDEEIERIGMEIAMEFERQQGREPEDVSAENLGFDIRSKSKDGEVRYIEVKARRDEGGIALTPNEWFKAKRFKDQYYLYVVANAVTNPILYIIRNPAENLKAMEKVEIVRFVISPEEWKNKGVKAT